MLRPLRAALGAWSPHARRSPLDPLAAIAAAWPQIVGPDLARAARPASIADDALVIVTNSSGWSQQLAFLSPEILRALAAIPAAAGIARLRFRVGRHDPARGRAAAKQAARVQPRQRPGVELEPAASLDEALDRIRVRFEQNRDAKEARGWKSCRRCGVTILGGMHCAPCAGSLAAEQEVAVQRLMYDAPWLGYGGTAAVIEALTVEEYERIRRALLERWWTLLLRVKADGRVSVDGRERRIASSYVLLHTGWEPQRITPAVVRNILGDDLMTFLYGT
jgi:hypothetical protein